MKLLSFIFYFFIITAHFLVISHFQEPTPYYNGSSDFNVDGIKKVSVDCNHQTKPNIQVQNKCNNYNHRPNFIHYSAAQFKNHFTYLNYSEEKILSLHMLYAFDEFIRCIKTLPGYELYITSLHEKLKKMNFFKKCIGTFTGTHYFRFTQRINYLYGEIQNSKQKNVSATPEIRIFERENSVPSYYYQEIIDILDFYDDQRALAVAIDGVVNNVYCEALIRNVFIDPVIETYLAESIDVIRTTQNCHQFVFEIMTVDHVLGDIQAKTTGQPMLLERSPELCIRAIKKFIESLNPIVQAEGLYGLAKNVLSAGFDAVQHPFQTAEKIRSFSDKSYEFLVHTAHFVSDVTIGKYYLSSDEYQQRVDEFWKKIKALSHEQLQKLTAEQVIDVCAQIAADVVFCRGLSSVCLYLKEIDVISSLQKQASGVAYAFKKAVDMHLAEDPLLVTAEGVVMKMDSAAKHIGGGAAREIITNSRMLIESTAQGVLHEVREKLDAVKQLFYRHAKFNGQWVTVQYEHILGMELLWNQKERLSKFGGFHHDLMHAIEKSGIIQFMNKVIYESGCYKADLIVDGFRVPGKTFFPAHWSREKVVKKIYEAYNNFVKNGGIPEFQKGKYHIIGLTNEGIEIEMYMTKNGEIKTAYPKLK